MTLCFFSPQGQLIFDGTNTHRPARLSGVTLGGFTLPDEIGSSRVAGGLQLPLRILTTQFTKVPAVIAEESVLTQPYTVPVTIS